MRFHGRALDGGNRPMPARVSRVRVWAGMLVLAAMVIGLAVPPGARGCLLRRGDAGVAERLLDSLAEGVAQHLPGTVRQALAASVERAHEHHNGAGVSSDPAVITNCASGIAGLPAHRVGLAGVDRLWSGPFDDVTGFAPSHDPPPPFHPPRVS